MSFEESLVGTTSGENQQPEMSSNSSASSNVNGQSDRLVDSSLPTASSSQSSFSQPTSMSLDAMIPAPGSDALSPSGDSTPDVDAQIIEALKSKDRLFVLKLGEQMEGLIRERHSRTKVLVTPENSYQRLLVHRCAAYYKLTPESDLVNRCFSVNISVESRLPVRRISELVPSEQTSHPQFKIMRRIEQDRRRQRAPLSRAGSVAGEEADGSDREPSEAGSMGGRSNASKKRSLAEREAAYLEARARIFHDLREKENEKERDMSASSSTLSLTSASASGSGSGGAGGSNAEDVEDDSRSTAPPESERSAPTVGSQGRPEANLNAAVPYQSRSSPYDSHSGNADASGRASPNPSNYASISDPHHANAPSEPNGYSHGAYLPPYPVFYPPPPGQPVPYPQYHYLQPYLYHPPHHFPPPPPHATSDPVSPVTAPVDGYPPQGVPYMHPMPYMWQASPHPATGGQISMTDGHVTSPGPSPQTHAIQSQGGIPPMQYPPQPFPSYMPPHQPYGPYPVHPYPHIPGPLPMNHPHSQPIYPIELPPINGPPEQSIQGGSGPSSNISSGTNSPSPTMSRRTNGNHSPAGGHQQQNNAHPGNGYGAYKRGGGHPPNRGAWSYGPGVGMHQHMPVNAGTEGVGPRFASVRRTSGASSNGNRTPGDETASTASSSTSSSSSKRTYMSNMSTPPKHPLPPRPDWATGLKAQPTLHPPRSRHDSNNNSRNMSPARPPGSAQAQNQSQQPQPQQLPPIFLQSTDFPPLSTMTNTEKRPSVGGAWTNPKSTARTSSASNISGSSQGQGGSCGNALFDHGLGGNQNNAADRLADDERGFERPPPKNNMELFNPKGGVKRNPQAPAQRAQARGLQTFHLPAQPDTGKMDSSDKTRGEAIASAILIEKVSTIKLQEQHGQDGDGKGSAVMGIIDPASSTGMTDTTAPAADGSE